MGVHAWAETLIGPVSEVFACQGGMSPGCVVILRGRRDRVFVKAVGRDLNPRTPELYRHEAAVVRLLPDVEYRPALRGVYDDGDWVAIALEAIGGEHPDMTDPVQLRAVRDQLARQSAELASLRPPIPTLAELASAWVDVWSDNSSRESMPEWLRARRSEFDRRVAGVPDRLPPDQLVHWDAQR
jgi:hypothetical protein